jgi:hypothetical protein
MHSMHSMGNLKKLLGVIAPGDKELDVGVDEMLHAQAGQHSIGKLLLVMGQGMLGMLGAAPSWQIVLVRCHSLRG